MTCVVLHVEIAVPTLNWVSKVSKEQILAVLGELSWNCREV
jgi:hypothetical protein